MLSVKIVDLFGLSGFVVIFGAMLRQEFSYDLPASLIAQAPLAQRSASRMLMVDGATGEYRDAMFQSLPEVLQAGDLLVFNNTRVIPARLHGRKQSGGKVEVLVERILDEVNVLAFVKASKAPKVGGVIEFTEGMSAEVIGRREDLFELCFTTQGPLLECLEQQGEVPLPPYIERSPDSEDKERYQTIYAQQPGAVAAPTAGLHFDESVFQRLRDKGVEFAYVTLHVGAGTFKPMRVDKLEDHQMHQEIIEVSEEVCHKVQRAKKAGRRVIAVGTTVVRALESAAAGGSLKPYAGGTDIFIYPGYRFKVMDGLITNFHLPESTLLMLVCAYGGYETVMSAYRHAVDEKYRFFSYGDAMLLWPEARVNSPSGSER